MKTFYNWVPPINPESGKFIFVSYCHANHKVLQEDLQRFSTVNAPLWYDHAIIPSEDWKQKAVFAMTHKNCCGAIFYISVESLQSDACFQELQLASELAKNDPSFRLCSVNLGGKSISEMLKLSAAPKVFASLYLKVFNERVIFIPRLKKLKSHKHDKSVLNFFDVCGVLPKEYRCLLADKLFDYKDYENGIVITKYNGTFSDVIIPAYIDDKPVLAVGAMAFADNVYLKNLTIEDGIITLVSYAFRKCKNLQAIHFPDSVRYIGYECFRECSSLQNVRFPDSLAELGDYALYMCSKLKAVSFGFAPVNIGYAAFSQCVELFDITLSENTVGIQGYAFGGCAFSQLVIPTTANRFIGEDICVCNENLQTIIFGNTALAKHMPNSICSLSPALKEIIVPFDMSGENYKYLSVYGYPVMRYLPTVQSFSNDENGFLWTPIPHADYYQLYVNGILNTVCDNRLDYIFTSSSYSIKLIAKSNHSGVISFPYAIEYNIKLPDVKNETLNGGSFPFGKIDLNGTSVKQIAAQAFYTDYSVRSLHSGACRLIGARAFEACSSLETVTFDNKIELKDYCFAKCTTLKEINNLPLATISKGAFSECVSLRSVDMRGRDKIPDSAFYRCHNLAEVLTSGLIILGKECFRGCMALDCTEIPEGVRIIEEGALSYICITHINLPSTLEDFGKGNLQHCSYLREINVRGANSRYSSVNGVLFDGNTLLRYPPSKRDNEYLVDAEKVADRAFFDQVYLNKITISANTKLLQSESFLNCDSLTEIIITAPLQIEPRAFARCEKLRQITMPRELAKALNFAAVGIGKEVLCIES